MLQLRHITLFSSNHMSYSTVPVMSHNIHLVSYLLYKYQVCIPSCNFNIIYKDSSQHVTGHTALHTFSFKSSVAGLGAASVTFSGTRRVSKVRKIQKGLRATRQMIETFYNNFFGNQGQKFMMVTLLAIIQTRNTQATKAHYFRKCARTTTATPLSYESYVMMQKKRQGKRKEKQAALWQGQQYLHFLSINYSAKNNCKQFLCPPYHL